VEVKNNIHFVGRHSSCDDLPVAVMFGGPSTKHPSGVLSPLICCSWNGLESATSHLTAGQCSALPDQHLFKCQGLEAADGLEWWLQWRTVHQPPGCYVRMQHVVTRARA